MPIQDPIALLKELVLVDSGTHNSAGVEQVQKIVQREASKLGFQVKLEKGREGSASFLVGMLGLKGPYVDLVSHADTVFDESFSGFNQDAGIARGPGVIDDKGGIVVALLGVAKYLAKGGPHLLAVRLICAPSEELGSPGFHDFFARMGRESRMVLGFEPALEDGSIIDSRRGNRWYHVKIQGKEAHAGRDPQNGVNAAYELAHKLVKLQGLNDPAQGVSVSAGEIRGGKRYNIVCGEAEAKIDARFGDFSSRDLLHGEIQRIVEKPHLPPNAAGELPKSSFEVDDDCPPFSLVPESEKYARKYREIISGIEGRTIGSSRSGGSADANYMSRPGLIVLDGLGPCGGGIHTREEFLNVASIESRAQALADFLAYVGEGGV